MALINCKECNKEISDQAQSCPHCGAPLQSNNKPTTVHNPNQDLFLTRNRGCFEVACWFLLALIIIAGLKSCM
jgi:predicted amidophosphoribosyltransferase